MKSSFTYILSNKRRSILYIGVTSNLYKRIVEHKSGKGSIFTEKYSIKDLLYFEEFTSIDQAIAREKQLKNWHREWKWNLIKQMNPGLRDLFEDLTPN
jgi:putative endonuclease